MQRYRATQRHRRRALPRWADRPSESWPGAVHAAAACALTPVALPACAKPQRLHFGEGRSPSARSPWCALTLPHPARPSAAAQVRALAVEPLTARKAGLVPVTMARTSASSGGPKSQSGDRQAAVSAHRPGAVGVDDRVVIRLGGEVARRLVGLRLGARAVVPRPGWMAVVRQREWRAPEVASPAPGTVLRQGRVSAAVRLERARGRAIPWPAPAPLARLAWPAPEPRPAPAASNQPQHAASMRRR